MIAPQASAASGASGAAEARPRLTFFFTAYNEEENIERTVQLALEQIASSRFPLERITTHRFGLKDAALAIKSVGGQGVPDVIHASLMPWL